MTNFCSGLQKVHPSRNACLLFMKEMVDRKTIGSSAESIQSIQERNHPRICFPLCIVWRILLMVFVEVDLLNATASCSIVLLCVFKQSVFLAAFKKGQKKLPSP